jgi:prevent-host-death family protein
MDMLTVSAAEFQRNFGRYQDEALKQPLSISRNGRERLVVLAVEEYERLRRRDRQVLGLADFTADDIAALEAARAPEAAKAFDHEINT